MIKVTLPDGSQREYPKGSTSLDVAKSISEGLARNVLSAVIDGEVWDATRPLEKDVTLRLLTWDAPEGKSTFWHSSAHLMAEALEALYPGVKLGIGPAIENGFYYDVDLAEKNFHKMNSKR
jgi:threonyl-tRNA synthetase